MILSEFFTALSFGPLSNLSMANDGFGTIKTDKDKSKIVFHLNDGLIDLYTRFVLKENEMMLTITQDNYIYELGDPVVKPLKVYTESGVELPINDENNSYSVFTPKPQSLQIPIIKETAVGNKLAIIYQALHPLINLTDAEDAEIYLPRIMNKLLFNYVAWKVYSDMNGQENLVKSQELQSAYESGCDKIVEKDLVSNSVSTTVIRKFEQKGFV